MKHILKFCAMFLVLVLIASLVPISVSAEETTPEEYELVLLIDVSGSMNTSDPPDPIDKTRLSVEAARAFAYYCPYGANMYISLITYSSDVFVAAEKLNVGLTEDKIAYEDILDKINRSELTGIKCWDGQTNTGAAMAAAKEILASSTATQKSVLLFTDGKTQVEESTSAITTAESIKLAKDTAAAFGEAKVPVYCVGLDAVKNNIDEAFLKEIAKLSGGYSQVCYNAKDVNDAFTEISRRFFDGSGGEGDDQYALKPNQTTTHDLKVYGQSTKESNVALFSDTAITGFRVINPSGKIVAEVDTIANTETVDSKLCIIDRAANSKIINIKLLEPADGTWSISMTSDSEGIVKVREIFLYDITLQSNIPASLSAGEPLNATISLQNENTGKAITAQSNYRASTMTATVTNTANGETWSYNGVLNSTATGFSFGATYEIPGRYQVHCLIENDQFTTEKTFFTEVLPLVPVLSVERSNYALGESVELKVQFKQSTTGNIVHLLPAYLSTFDTMINVSVNGAANPDVIRINGSSFKNGTATHSYTPSSEARYTYSGVVTVNGTAYTAEVGAGSFDVVRYPATLSFSNTDCSIGETLTATLGLKDPISGKQITTLPEQLKSLRFTIELMKGDTVVESRSLASTDFVSNVFTAVFTPAAEGEYTLRAKVFNSAGQQVQAIEANDDAKMTVTSYQGTLTVPTEGNVCKDGAEITLTLKKSNGEAVSELPANVELKATVSVLSGGSVVESFQLSNKDFKDGKLVCSFKPSASGTYSVSADVTVNGVKVNTASASLTFANSTIKVDDTMVFESIAKKNANGKASCEIDFTGLFADSDGDSLTYSVEASDPECVEALLNGTVLTINVTDFTTSTVTITAKDAYGASATFDIPVELTSSVGIIIGCIIGVIVLIVLVIAALLFVKKRRIIRMAFNVKITENDSYEYIVYRVGKLANKRNVKPTMKLSEILRSERLCESLHGELDEELLEEFISDYAPKISLTGLVFKKGIQITRDNGKRKQIFQRAVVTVQTDKYSVAFGTTSAFDEED